MADTLGLQGVELLSHDSGGGLKRVQAADVLGAKTVGLYFSAHWCPPCQAFTPILAEVYQTLRQKREDFEIVFISGDRDAAQATEYFGRMPWLAVPFEEHIVRQQLSHKFGVTGIPRLVIVGPTGEIIAHDARSAIMSDRRGEQFPWHNASVGPVSLMGLLASPRGMLLLFIMLYYVYHYFTKRP